MYTQNLFIRKFRAYISLFLPLAARSGVISHGLPGWLWFGFSIAHPLLKCIPVTQKMRSAKRHTVGGRTPACGSRQSGYSQSASLLVHNRIAASQLIRSGLYHSWYKQVPTHCLLLCAIEAGDLLNSVKKIKYHEVPRMSIMSQGNFFYPFYGQKFYCSKTRKKTLRTSDLLQSSKSLSFSRDCRIYITFR